MQNQGIAEQQNILKLNYVITKTVGYKWEKTLLDNQKFHQLKTHVAKKKSPHCSQAQAIL